MYMLNISILVCAKNQKASAKALVQVDFPVDALSKHKQNLKANRKKWQSCHFVKKYFWHQTSSCNCSVCLYCAGKVSRSISKNCGTSWFPCMCTIFLHMSYKMAKLDKQTFCQKVFLHICIVYAKYQKVSSKTLVQVDFLLYALSKHKHDPYLKADRKKWLSSQNCHFVKNYFSCNQTSSWKCSMCLYCVSKVSD